MIPRNFPQKTILVLVVSILVGCGSRVAPPTVNEILAQPDSSVTTGENINLTVDASGTGMQFEWAALRGRLSDPNQPAVVYTAPDTPGVDTVTVRVTYEGGEIIRNITLEIVAPPTVPLAASPIPVDTPTPVPAPIACSSPAITKNVFPQLADEEGQLPFYGPTDEPKYACEAVYDIVHDHPLAIHLKYENVGANFGWWGIGTPKGYDAASFSEICFWAYAQQPNQSFRLKMKDTSPKENGLIIIIEQANQWTQTCTDLAKFADLGIRLSSLENVNLGFEQPTGRAEIWVADFEFK